MWSSAGGRGGKKGTEEKAPERESQSPAHTVFPPRHVGGRSPRGPNRLTSSDITVAATRDGANPPDKRDRSKPPENALARWYDVRHLNFHRALSADSQTRHPPPHPRSGE